MGTSQINCNQILLTEENKRLKKKLKKKKQKIEELLSMIENYRKNYIRKPYRSKLP